ncbi:MAG TPA: hypothetical protein VI483_03070 [Candidatus Paceibacterota bacterium]
MRFVDILLIGNGKPKETALIYEVGKHIVGRRCVFHLVNEDMYFLGYSEAIDVDLVVLFISEASYEVRGKRDVYTNAFREEGRLAKRLVESGGRCIVVRARELPPAYFERTGFVPLATMDRRVGPEEIAAEIMAAAPEYHVALFAVLGGLAAAQ